MWVEDEALASVYICSAPGYLKAVLGRKLINNQTWWWIVFKLPTSIKEERMTSLIIRMAGS